MPHAEKVPASQSTQTKRRNQQMGKKLLETILRKIGGLTVNAAVSLAARNKKINWILFPRASLSSKNVRKDTALNFDQFLLKRTSHLQF